MSKDTAPTTTTKASATATLTTTTTSTHKDNKTLTNGKTLSNGVTGFDKSHRNSAHYKQPPQKSIIVAYFLWLIGGFFGLHHLYLHRDRHAFVWWCTFGGYFGIGWFYELFLIPQYVRDANEDPRFVAAFIERMKKNQKPPYECIRFVGEVLFGYFLGQLIQMAIPQTPFLGIDWAFLHWLIPPFIAIGVWTVGNIGRECGVLYHCLLAAIAVYPIRYFIYDETYTFLITAVVSALAFDYLSKQWRSKPPVRQKTSVRAIKFTGALFIYFSVWGCFIFFNGTISYGDGEEMPIHEAFQNFLASPWWTNLKQALIDTYQYAQHHGWYEIWKEIYESMDVDGERNSYKVLEVSATASQAEITAAYRRLSKEYHPDKVKDETQRAAANQKFIEIQQAYNTLSKMKSSRRRKNTKYNEDQ